MRRHLNFLIVCCLFLLLAHSAWSRGGGGCFLPDTLILRDDGTSVAISQMVAGEKVKSYESNGKLVQSEVRAVIKHEVNSYYQLTTEKIMLNVTGEHPIYLGDGKFKTVATLTKGDMIYIFDGNILTPERIINIKPIAIAATVYNLQTDEPHTYFAGGVAVHNKGGGGGGGGGGFSGGGGGRSRPCAPNDSVCKISKVIDFIIFGGFFIYFYLKGKDNDDLDYVNSRANIDSKSKKTMKLLDFLAKQDREMSPTLLTDRTRHVFTLLQQCWMKRDYAPMKDLMMPDLYRQHCKQIQGMISNHEINQLVGMEIEAIDLVNVRYTEEKYQREFTALITASATDYYIDDRTSEYLRGDKEPASFQEFWTFELEPDGWLLRDIEQSRESDYLKEENFVEMMTDLQIQKIYGDKVDNLGTSGPWLPKQVAQKENKVDRMLNFLSKSNKMWDRQSMIVRVRSVFTQVHMAMEAGNLDAETENTLFPSVAAEMKTRLEAWRALGNTIQYRNFCVRKVEILLVKSFNDKSKNEFTARISAHAQIIHLKNGETISADKDVTLFIELWEFGMLDNAWKLKSAAPASESDIVDAENIEEDSSPNLVKWYYTKKRAL